MARSQRPRATRRRANARNAPTAPTNPGSIPSPENAGTDYPKAYRQAEANATQARKTRWIFRAADGVWWITAEKPAADAKWVERVSVS